MIFRLRLRARCLRPSASPIRRLHRLLALLVVNTLCAQAAGPEADRIARMLHDASRALQAGNAASFLSHFDRERFAGYTRLETDVVALTRQNQVASSIEIIEIKPDGEAYAVQVDWVLQLSLLSAPGPIESRQEQVTLRAAQVKKRWKIVQLEPIGFFRPPDTAGREP